MSGLEKIIITDITGVITVASPKGRMEKITNRQHYGLSFCNEGQITYTHNGIEYISDPQHAIILPKGQSYSIHGDKSGMFPVINFECEGFLADTMKVINVDDTDFIMREFEQMKKLFLFERNRAKVMSIFYNIIHTFSVESDFGNNALFPAIKYIESNYSSPELTNTVLAKQCGISEVYFRKLFLSQFGTTPWQYIIDVRINKAKQLLTEGRLKINAISENCGFSNQYHFCRLFKEKTGLTPTQYMNKNRIFKI